MYATNQLFINITVTTIFKVAESVQQQSGVFKVNKGDCYAFMFSPVPRTNLFLIARSMEKIATCPGILKSKKNLTERIFSCKCPAKVGQFVLSNGKKEFNEIS